MSQKDKKTTRRDRILVVLRQHRALSTTQITTTYNRKYETRYNNKTIERDIRYLLGKGKVVPNPPIGREQTYSVSQEPRLVSEFFISQFWKDLNDYRNLNVTDSLGAFWNTRSLIKTYPGMYEALESDIKKTQRSLETHKEKEQYGYYDIGVFVLCGVPEVEDLIGKVAIFLHEQFEKLQKEKKVQK